MCVIEVPFYTFSHIIRPLGIQRQDIMLDEQPMGRGKKKKEGKNRGWSEIIPGFRFFGNVHIIKPFIRLAYYASVSHPKTGQHICSTTRGQSKNSGVKIGDGMIK